MLFDAGLVMEQKPFSIGLRAEHSQSWLDEALFGNFAGHPALGAAEYQLSHKALGRGVYSFCMCPGGQVVNASSEAGGLVVNGMSHHARAGQNANAAIVASVGPGDFGSSHPLAGIDFQRSWEKAAFLAGGGRYAVPIQRLGDYLEGKKSARLGAVLPSCPSKVEPADLNAVLPPFANEMLRAGFAAFGRKIRGFDGADTLLSGVESRTSAPLRLLRDERGRALKHPQIYPCGEGAGYAGGIMSAAVDGIRTALHITEHYAPPAQQERSTT